MEHSVFALVHFPYFLKLMWLTIAFESICGVFRFTDTDTLMTFCHVLFLKGTLTFSWLIKMHVNAFQLGFAKHIE